MIKNLFTLFVISLFSWSLMGQCPSGGVVLNDQAEVDAFIAAYPNCTAIEGVLTIGDGTVVNDISDISGLSNITSIGLNLRIGNTQLINLTGLNNVLTIGGSCGFVANPNLVSLQALSLVSTTTGFIVVNNASLTSLLGLGNSSFITMNQLTILNNPQLSTCEVESICNYLAVPTNSTNIGNNASGCDSRIEIEDACDFMTGPICPLGDVTLTSQAAVDFYVATFPNCTTINGTLSIGDGSGLNDITNISGLSNITSVAGDLIVANTALTALSGLNNITTVGANLLIETNPNLTALHALNSITSVNGFLRVENNASLTSLLGVGNSPAIGLTLVVIINNPQLGTCEVDNVCDYLEIPSNLATIANNAPGCNSRMEVEEACSPIVFEGCPENLVLLTQAEVEDFLVQYPNCTEIQGFIKIGDGNNPTDIDDLTPLSNLIRTGGTVSIFFNPNLNSLAGLNNMVLIGGNLGLWGNSGLTNMQGLESLVRIRGSLNVHGNDNIIDFEGLNSLSNVGDRMDIESNFFLEDFSGLESLTSVGGFMGISSNPFLNSLAGLNSLSSVGSDLHIKFNPDLVNVDGLSALSTVDSDLVIESNGSLTNVDGLSSLASVGGNLAFLNNGSLTSLLGMSSLTSINGFLVIRSNAALTTLEGLENINPAGISRLYIVANPMLSTCDVESICTYLALPASLASIAGNNKDCVNRSTVEEACNEGAINDFGSSTVGEFSGKELHQSELSIDIASGANIKLYPNPTNGILQVRNISAQLVVVFNAQGQRMLQFDNPGTELDMSTLSAGVYYLNFLTAEGSITKRIAKLD